MSVSRWYTRDVCCVRTGSRYILQFAESWYMIRVRACTIFLFVLAGLLLSTSFFPTRRFLPRVPDFCSVLSRQPVPRDELFQAGRRERLGSDASHKFSRYDIVQVGRRRSLA